MWRMLVVMFTWSSLASATTYYVDATHGNDTNNGRSTAAAWKTFAKINSTPFSPGDAILLERGEQWREQLLILSSGNATNSITYGAYGTGENPVINGADVLSGWTPTSGNRYTASVSTQPELVVFNGTKGTRAASAAEVDALREWYWEGGTLTIYSAASPVNIEASARQFILFVNSQQYITIRDLTVQYGVDSVCLYNTKYVVADHLNIRDNAGYGSVYLTASTAGTGQYNTIQDCVIENTTASLASAADANYGSGVFVWGVNICGHNTFTRNILRNNGHEGIGILQSSNNLISYNEAYQNAQVGLRIALEESTSNIIEHNTSYLNCHGFDDRFGIDLIRVGNDNIVRYNIVHDQQTVVGGPYGSGGIRFDGGDWAGHDHMGSTGNKAYYNVVYNEYTGIMSFNHSNIEIYNNVVYNTSHFALVIHSVSTVIPSGNIAKNNIVYTAQGLVFYHNNETNSLIDYNYYMPNASTWFYWNGSLCNFANWKSGSGLDVHSAEIDPKFVNPAGLDFHLQSNSPCIDAGTPLGIATDFDDDDVPQGNGVDIGVFETAVVTEAPTAAFSGTPTSGTTPLTVSFTDASTAGTSPITSRAWAFGDGGTSTDTNPSHTYSTPGSYTVTLTVTTAVGSDIETKTNYVTANPVAPTANFTGTPTTGATPLTVNFTDTSTAGTSPITSRSWAFGDGGTSTATNPSHTYSTPGSYTVTLTVTTAVGSDGETKTNYVSATPVAPTANFSGTPLTGATPLTVSFTDTSTAGTSAITGRSWAFGDGGTSTATNPSHTYATPGSYTVVLTVTTAVGSDSETKSNYVTANPVAPTANFTGTPTVGSTPLTVNFTDTSTAGTSPITSRLWAFGDGGTSTSSNPSHTYSTPGSYTVSLTVTSAGGSDGETKTSYITANPVAPTANFTGTPTSGASPLTVSFTDTSTAGTSAITGRSWAFGDGGTSTAANPSHTYSTPGAYTVSLTVTTAVGSDGETKTSYITANPVAPTANFTGTPTSGPTPLTVSFTDTSTAGTSPITAYSWDFGDGGTSTQPSPSHTYLSTGTYTVALSVTTAVSTNTMTKVNYITANLVPPTAAFSGTPATGATPLTVDFSDASTDGTSAITSYAWDFGDGGTSLERNPSHTYLAPGSYTVSLTVISDAGSDEEVKADYIAANPVGPTAAFSATPTSGATPLTVDFADSSSPGTSPITDYAWDFGDGGTSTEAHPSHVYTSPGSYTVSLIVTTAVGSDEEAKVNYITANPVGPTANFSGAPSSGSAPLVVNFTNMSTAGTSPITSYSWDFGDGGSSAQANPSHTYTVPGTYTVILTVTTAAGTDEESKADYVIANPVGPTANFAATPTTGSSPLGVSFTDASVAGTSPITSYSWDFGDGGASTEANPNHTYAAPGSYTVTLTVTTTVGSDQEIKTNYITAMPVAPIANFTGTPTTGSTPLTVNFSDTSTAGTSAITSYAWGFGDGGTSAEANPSHTYTAPGTYTVTLTVTSAAGTDVETKADYITSSPVGPTADFAATPRSGSTPLDVHFSDASTAGTSPITSYSWDFGDGETSTEANPNHTYTTPGSYDVILTIATDLGSDAETKTNYITVNPLGPTANFTGIPTSGVSPLTVNFTNTSTAGTSPITGYSWDFGDSGTSTEANPSHTYTVTGTYTVTLAVTTAIGVDDITKTNYITVDLVPPTAMFSGVPTSGDAPLAVHFTDESIEGSSPITSYAWNFGDGGTSTEQNPDYTYTVPGVYMVSLTVFSDSGSDDETKFGYITVNAVAPSADFTGAPTLGLSPLTVNFMNASTAGSSPITEYAWDFGDGGSSTAIHPSHVFTSPGTYTVTLTVMSDAGSDTEIKSGYILVDPVLPIADFAGTPTVGSAPLTVNFTDASAAGTSLITSYAWDFGDGGTSAEVNPSHVYSTPGTYTVTLAVTTAAGSDGETKTNYITANPVTPTADFVGTPTVGSTPLTVSFTDASAAGTSPITSYAWDFGDGATSAEVNPSHVYSTPGAYTVSLIVTTDAGTDEESKVNYITATRVAPAADFVGTPATGSAPLKVNFTDISSPGTSPITSYAWDFGDGGTSAEANPSYTYAVPGSYTVTLTVTSEVGSDGETKPYYITVNPVAPVADFAGMPVSGSAPLTVSFADLSTPGTSPITHYAWDFGDGGTSAEANPSHVYSSPGTYAVSLTVTTDVGSDNEIKPNYITANPVAPVADFVGLPMTGPAPLTVVFSNTSTAGTSPITRYAWDFGDGGTSAEANPSHVYSSPGAYAVRLTVTTEVGSDGENKPNYITANPVAPIADFTGLPTTGPAPLTVDFSNTSTAGTSPITSYAWDFGDGGTSTEANPSHTFSATGTYTVSLTVTTAVGPNTVTKTNYITADLIPPIAGFTGAPTSGSTPLTVSFTDTSSDGSSPVTSYQWHFGDGGSSTQKNPSHIYTIPGTYTVTLTAISATGSDEETKASYITANPVAPVAKFSATPTMGSTPLTVKFSDASEAGTSPITSRVWAFGDGATSTEMNPSHLYVTPGVYNVTLTVTSAVGSDIEAKANYITANPVAPIANFTGTPTTGSAPLSVQFTDTSVAGTSAITSRLWAFGDGATSTEANPRHTYAAPGTYTVGLTVTTAAGSDVETKTNYVKANPVAPTANFTGTPTTGPAPLSVQFADTSISGTSSITSRLWTFGDGVTSAEANPSHTYAAPGTYTVGLTVTTAAGSDVETKASYITVNPVAPTADFTGNPMTGTAPLLVSFTNTSTAGTSPITQYAWSFGDGETSAAISPSHVYAAAGVYTVTLEVTTVAGSDSEVKTGYISVENAPGGPIWFVDVSSDAPIKDGLSWATAFTTIQPAIDAAAAKGDEVWVAKGTYSERRISELGYPAVDTGSLVLREGVRVYGGFVGSETARSQRDAAANETVIDGSTSRTDNGMPAYHVVVGANSSTLDGFKVRGGGADGTEFPYTTGAGLFNWAVSPTVENCTFADNTAQAGGGGIANYQGATPVIRNCTFDTNHAALGGGAMANADGATPQVQDCGFSNNTAENGAGMFNWNASPVVSGCTFTSNIADNLGGGMANDSSAQPVLTQCTFTTNQAPYGGAMANNDHSSPSLTACVFFRNSGTNAGAILNQDGSAPELFRCTFKANAATNGGGLYNSASSPTFTNCILLSNLAVEQGGAILNKDISSPVIINCTFTRNSARTGGALANLDTSSPALLNCILWADAPAELNTGGGTATLNYCDVRGGYAGTANINTDPLFASVLTGNLDLQEGSPCIDAGFLQNAPEVDIQGRPRPQGAGVDIGAYESSAGSGEGEGTAEGSVEGGIEGAVEGSAEGSVEGEPFVEPPTINLQPGAQLVAAGDSVSFTVEASGPAPLWYEWQKDSTAVEGGTEATLTLQNVQTADQGIYRCKVSNQGGFVLSDAATLTISVPPVADFSVTPVTGAFPLTVYCTDKSVRGTLPIIGWLWDFGDGSTSREQNPSHVYANPGVYTVALVVASDFDSNGVTRLDLIRVTAQAEGEGSNEGEGGTEGEGEAEGDGEGLLEGEGAGEGEGTPEGEGSVEGETYLWFVDVHNAQGAHDGRSWATAFTSIQAGIDAAYYSGGGEVWVAAGVYAESRSGQMGNPPQSTGALMLAETVAVYGGFTGNETDRSQRDWAAHATIIDGSTSRGGKPAYHVVVGTDDAVLDGFIIRGGRADGTVYPFNVGGGLFNFGVSPSLAHCTWTRCYARLAGGAIANDSGAKPTLDNCSFTQNAADQAGGGVSYTGGSGGTITDCTFSYNSSAAGGALCIADSSFAMTRCVLSNNTATQSGGALLLQQNATVRVSECAFSNNSANTSGGAIANTDNAAPIVEACQFSGNSANAAGAVHAAGTSKPSFARCLFTANTAAYGAAVMNDETSAASFTNCVFHANAADNMGGGALNAVSSTATYMNCSFGGNSATSAGGVANVDNALPVIVNCVLWDDVPEEFVPDDTANVTYSDIEGGHSGKGNLKVNPGYVDLANGDLRLKSSSSAIDAGTTQGAPAVDLAGQVRPWGDAVDMGAFEYAGGEGEGEGESPPEPGWNCFSQKSGSPLNPADLFVAMLAVLAALVSYRHLERKE